MSTTIGVSRRDKQPSPKSKESRSSRCIYAAAIIVPLVISNVVSKADESASSLVEQGRYLATAGNCVSCHTREGGESFAGGVAFETPFGTMYSTNITSDSETGIGEWTQEEFARALREGVRPNGDHLYPAFPYPAYTNLSDADTVALFAYLKTVPPVSYTPPENDLDFPYSQRWALGLWKTLYFEPGRFVAREGKSVEWNRGAYLVKGLGHCGACHTPRNFMGASDSDLALTGGTYKDKVDGKLLDWSATNLTSAHSGLGSWSVEDIASYLKLGLSSRASVFGPMNEVVLNSTRHLTEQDIRAMAVYLRSLPANTQDSGSRADEEILRMGSIQYDIHCGTCHLPTGLGAPETGPPLVGSPVVLAPDPASLINITLYGAQIPELPPSRSWQERAWKVMEPFGHKLNNEQAASILSYIRSAWSNEAGEVTPEQIAEQR